MVNVSKTVKRIDINKLIFDGNPRTDVSMKIDKMIASYQTRGFEQNSTVMVEERDNGEYLVIQGNRRSISALTLQEQDREAFDRIFPDGKIPAFIAKGLSDQDRILLRIDHSTELDREPLDDEGLFNAVCQLLRAGLNQKGIASHLHLFTKNKKTGELEPNRSKVQRRAELAKLPNFVQDEYRLLMQKGNEATAVRWGMIPKLYKLYMNTYVEYPDGTVEFRELWEGCKTPKEETEGTSTVSVKLTPKKAVDFSQLAQSVGVRDILLSVTGQSQKTFDNIDLSVLKGEQATATLSAIHDYLGNDDYNNLIAESIKAETTEDVETENQESETVEHVEA